MIGALIVLGIVALAALLLAGLYNALVSLRNRYKNAWAQIDVQLKRRYDLIPNLVETARAYLAHERETLEAVIAARNEARAAAERAGASPDPEAIRKVIGAESTLAGALVRFSAVAEQYPELKADRNMAQLSEELTSTENRIAFARQAYNDAVMRYNTRRETFPAVMIAGTFGFSEAPLFEVEQAAERQAPKVSFA